MRIAFKYSVILFIPLLFLLIVNSCKKKEVPTVTTSGIDNITATTAISGGRVTNEGSAKVIERGVCWSTGEPSILDSKTSDGIGAGSFTSNISDLNPATLYWVRAYATNSFGTGYGMAMMLLTKGQYPNATTLPATDITTTTVTLNGIVNPNHLTSSVTFEYGTTTAYGQTSNAIESPVSGNTNVNVSVNITGLDPATTYHFRVVSQNSLGTSYGDDMTFATTITGITGTLNDINGNIYHSIGIGYQMWMVENLRTTLFNDNTAIPLVTDITAWNNLSSPGYTWYNNDEANFNTTYGAMYNWYAVNTGKLCPSGWHIPTDAEWTTLLSFLGGESIAGGKLKETGIAHWLNPNVGATNETGFTALPGGDRNSNGTFYSIGEQGNWWSSTENPLSNAYKIAIRYDEIIVYRDNLNKQYGLL